MMLTTLAFRDEQTLYIAVQYWNKSDLRGWRRKTWKTRTRDDVSYTPWNMAPEEDWNKSECFQHDAETHVCSRQFRWDWALEPASYQWHWSATMLEAVVLSRRLSNSCSSSLTYDTEVIELEPAVLPMRLGTDCVRASSFTCVVEQTALQPAVLLIKSSTDCIRASSLTYEAKHRLC